METLENDHMEEDMEEDGRVSRSSGGSAQEKDQPTVGAQDESLAALINLFFCSDEGVPELADADEQLRLAERAKTNAEMVAEDSDVRGQAIQRPDGIEPLLKEALKLWEKSLPTPVPTTWWDPAWEHHGSRERARRAIVNASNLHREERWRRSLCDSGLMALMETYRVVKSFFDLTSEANTIQSVIAVVVERFHDVARSECTVLKLAGGTRAFGTAKLFLRDEARKEFAWKALEGDIIMILHARVGHGTGGICINASNPSHLFHLGKIKMGIGPDELRKCSGNGQCTRRGAPFEPPKGWCCDYHQARAFYHFALSRL